MNYLIEHIQQYHQIFNDININVNDRNIIYLKGDLGSGKTSFIKEFMKNQFNYNDVSSPTFGLINTYNANGKLIYHYDLYRIKNTSEFEDIGLYQLLAHDNIHFIEWPEMIPKTIISPKIIINFSLLDKHRLLTVKML
tara:strand:- start:24 stop:437 length:414 start_codon:yes stop_codon:yes gene_type:complete